MPIIKSQYLYCSMEPNQMDIDKEQTYLLTKYDTLINYIKQLYLHISVVIRDGRPNNRDMLKSMVNCFDKAIEDYNQYLIYRRNNINEYLWVDGTTLFTEGLKLEPKIVRSYTNQIHRLDIVFIGSPIEGYKMHSQMWKLELEGGVSTNPALRKYQQTFLSHLKDRLISEHYIDEVKEFGFRIRSSKPKLMNRTKQISTNDKLFTLIEAQANSYLKMIKDRQPCPFCKKYYLYEARNQVFLPPTVIVDHLKQRQQFKFYHETCIIRSLKKIDRERQMVRVNNPHPHPNQLQRH